MRIKDGVRIHGITPHVVLALIVCQDVFDKYECIVTSVVDGKHSSGSLHYVGNAFDLRFWHIPELERPKIAERLEEALGRDFDVVLEKDHFHIEYQPKTGVNL